MCDYDYDLFVIGAGSGGVRAARMAAQYGARVAVAEESRVGGTCVIRGCVPKKLFVYAGHYGLSFAESRGFGWNPGTASFDWPSLLEAKDREIDRLNGIYISNLEKAGVEIVPERAVLAGPHKVRLSASGREVTARYILIAVGARPHIDTSIPGHEHVITSDDAFHLPELPEAIAICGASYIAVEFANIFHQLGVQTNLVYRRDRILRGFDDDLRSALMEEMRDAGIAIITDNVFTRIEKAEHGGLKGHLSGGQVLDVGAIMFAIGRRPYTAKLGLDAVGITPNASGAIPVDDYSKSAVDHIYAVGDVTDRICLTPVAIREGAAVAETLFNDTPTAVDHDGVATAVFSTPELGTVGLTETQAQEAHPNLDVYLARFRPMRHTLSGSTEKVLMKLIVDADTDRVLGLHMLCDGAAEMIQAFAISLKMGARKSDFDATVAVHPSAAEELVTMKRPTRRYRDGQMSSVVG